ncbi:hypothetical protein [Mesorhizobium sp. M7A.F.Ca.US.010.02.1.1]|uniref:hypothetical protein n=1 Tax=Mesorhizobium sp. M7A.F.Ca.US.010.02.1.1 TaxID=2496743 RepID=UPI000FD3CA35|nr:hypothetical protein [Mesorhizobium sp. M7A.F.Ca.US.010.02.1.1]RUW89919.1 hypothetical protein EOA19_23155 [Mesorhizobium sp. M7A.F.Ca.US.010.02.1.1]
MSLTSASKSLAERHAADLLAIGESSLRAEIGKALRSDFRDGTLGISAEGKFSSFYAPFDWVNTRADVVIVGITPGTSQATEALVQMRRSLMAGRTIEQAAEAAKQSASFKGTMRTLGARLMDHFDIHRLLGLETTEELFAGAAHRAHYTSVLRYPVLKEFANYSGDAKLMQRPMLEAMAESGLPDELGMLDDPWIVPFGPVAHSVLEHLSGRGLIASDRILGGLLHPSGTQWNRYNAQLDIDSPKKAMTVPGGPAVMERSAALRETVARHMAAKPDQCGSR